MKKNKIDVKDEIFIGDVRDEPRLESALEETILIM